MSGHGTRGTLRAFPNENQRKRTRKESEQWHAWWKIHFRLLFNGHLNMHRARFCFNPIPTWYAVQDLGCIGIQGRRYSFRILTVPGLGGRVRCESLNSFEQKGFQCTSECAECASLLDCKITQPTHIQAQLLWCLPACLFFVGILADQYVKWMDE